MLDIVFQAQTPLEIFNNIKSAINGLNPYESLIIAALENNQTICQWLANNGANFTKAVELAKQTTIHRFQLNYMSCLVSTSNIRIN